MPQITHIMPENYLSVCGEKQTQKIIEKSRFITSSRHVESEEEMRAFVAEISKKYPDATHNCYAAVCDVNGNLLRFSDDGEPSGTAGMPMLEVLKARRIVQTAVVVTRYFGGIKLGAGGLVRAYSGCVAENLDEAEKAFYELCEEYEISVAYPSAESATRYFGEVGANLLKTEYFDGVTFTVAVKKRNIGFSAGLINRLNGRVKIIKTGEYFCPFKA